MIPPNSSLVNQWVYCDYWQEQEWLGQPQNGYAYSSVGTKASSSSSLSATSYYSYNLVEMFPESYYFLVHLISFMRSPSLSEGMFQSAEEYELTLSNLKLQVTWKEFQPCALGISGIFLFFFLLLVELKFPHLRWLLLIQS